MPIVKVNGKDVHIQELNKGATETIVMIHGMFSNLSVYYFNIAPLLATHFHVVMYDLKSHGLSEKTLTGYDLESMANDLSDLLTELGLKKVYVAGYSFGGLISIKMALCFPELIEKLVIIEAPDPNDDQTRGIIDEYSREFLAHYVNNFTDTTKVKMGKRQMEKNHRMYEYLFHETSIKQDMLLEKDFFSNDQIRKIKQQTLLLYGEQSNCRDAGIWLHHLISNSTLTTAEGDHNLPIQQPNTVAQLLFNFFT